MFTKRLHRHTLASYLPATKSLLWYNILWIKLLTDVSLFIYCVLTTFLQRLWFTRLHPQMRRLLLVQPGSWAGFSFPGQEILLLSLSWVLAANISCWPWLTLPAREGACLYWVSPPNIQLKKKYQRKCIFIETHNPFCSYPPGFALVLIDSLLHSGGVI